MIYLTGLYALNIPDVALETCGDWHRKALNWNDPLLIESDKSIYKNYGIIQNLYVKEVKQNLNVANHIRALLDLISLGRFNLAEGMNKDFICNSGLNEVIFEKIMMLKELPIWNRIDEFMTNEYHFKWKKYKVLHI